MNETGILVDTKKTIMDDKAIVNDLSNHSFKSHIFKRLTAKQKKFQNVDFSYATFDACYLRDCAFDSCNFTGCRFLGTNLRGSTFEGCKFDYTVFEKTYVDSHILESSCPGFENLKREFARTLRMNYQQLGDATSVNKAISIELEATELHLKKAWESKESYYRKKYKGLRRAGVFFEWLNFKCFDVIWGNGESLGKLTRAVLVFLILLVFVDVFLYKEPLLIMSYWTAFHEIPAIFMGVFSPKYYPKWYLSIIVFLRLIFFAFFMSITIKRSNRR